MACECSGGSGSARRRWAEDEKRRMVGEVKASGLSISEVARRNDVHPVLLGRWMRKFGAERGGVTLVPVAVTMPEPEQKQETKERAHSKPDQPLAEVLLANGRRLVFREDISASGLRRLVAAVDGS